MFELNKLLPEVSFFWGGGGGVIIDLGLRVINNLQMLRRFDFEVVDEGQFIVSGGIAYNKGFKMNLHARQRKENRLFE